MEKLNMQTTDVVDENIKRIGEMFPNCLTEVKDEKGRPQVAIDFDQLRQELSKNIVEGPEERYQFTWPDKRNAIRLANAPTTDTLRQNLYIEGDNLQVLKLLRENYLGKVKMIYIDPPYNTGNDFVYNDNFDLDKQEYVHNSGQYDEQGNQLVTNTESNGRFHTDWLNMIYPRLKVAKDLLSEDGVIFISIDDHEVENIKKIGSEVFGNSNFIGIITIKGNPRGRQSSTYLAQVHDFLIVYRKSSQLKLEGFPISEEEIKSRFNKVDSSGNIYEEWELRKRGAASRREDVPTLYFPIYYNILTNEISTIKSSDTDIIILPKLGDGSDGRWRWSKEKIENDKSKLYVRKNNKGLYNIYERKSLEEKSTQLAPTIWDYSDVNTELGTKLVKSLFDNAGYFDFPKPLGLINRILKISTTKDSIILDFFSGSATTAHAVMQLNAEDGGKRKFIMVQLPEATDEKSEAYKAGYKNICEIGKERIRRAGKKIKEESPLTTQDLDTGFRVLKLDSSNMQDVYYTPEEFDQRDLFEDNIKSDRTEEDLLFQTMIDLGIDLSAKIEQTQIAGKTVWNVSDGYLMACFDEAVNETTITEIAKQQPYYFVMRDKSLANDNVADNFEQIFNHYSKDTIRRII